MPFSTKANLKTAVTNYLARTDLDSFEDDFITLAEARLNRMTELRTYEVDYDFTGTVSADSVLLPSDFVSPVGLKINASTVSDLWVELLPQTMEQMTIWTTPSGQPCAWAIDGNNIQFDRPLDQAYPFKFRYFSLLNLANDSDTNWLLTNHPDVYLAATMAEAYKMNKNAEGLQFWEAQFRDAIDQVQKVTAKSKSHAVLTADPANLYNNRNNWYRGGWFY